MRVVLSTSRPASGLPSKGIVLFLRLFPCPIGVGVEGIWDSVKGLLVGLMLRDVVVIEGSVEWAEDCIVVTV